MKRTASDENESRKLGYENFLGKYTGGISMSELREPVSSQI